MDSFEYFRKVQDAHVSSFITFDRLFYYFADDEFRIYRRPISSQACCSFAHFDFGFRIALSRRFSLSSVILFISTVICHTLFYVFSLSSSWASSWLPFKQFFKVPFPFINRYFGTLLLSYVVRTCFIIFLPYVEIRLHICWKIFPVLSFPMYAFSSLLLDFWLHTWTIVYYLVFQCCLFPIYLSFLSSFRLFVVCSMRSLHRPR